MKNIKPFALLEFNCPTCGLPQEIDITKKVENKHNYDCNCGAKFFVDRVKGKVLIINREEDV